MSIQSLTQLNTALIRSAVTPQVEEGDDSLDEFLGGTGQTITVIEADSGPGSWSTALPFEYRQARDWIRTSVFGGSYPKGMETFVTAFVKGWGEKVFEETGGEEDGGEWPTLAQLLERDDFLNGVQWLPYVQARLPAAFTTEDENGALVMATSDPLTGVTFSVVPDQGPLAEAARTGGEATQQPLTRNVAGAPDLSPENAARVEQMGEPGIVSAAPGTPGGIPAQAGPQGTPKTIQDFLRENPEVRQAAISNPVGVQHIPLEDLTARLQTATGGGGRGGGGGGGGRREIVFDKPHLMSQAERRYESWLLEGAPPETIERIVDEYIRDATAFWQKGGQRDFDTFVNDRLRGLPRYKMIFRHKPESATEEQYVSDFAAPIAQLGLRPETTREQTVGALTSGGSPTEQLRRVGRSREAQQSRPFSKELASTLSGLGAAARFG